MSRIRSLVKSQARTIVIKPSEFTPFSGLLYGVLAQRAGIPAGVVNLVTGDGAAVGGELSANNLVRKITFTGSARVGKLLYKKSADSMKKLSMELGGNAPTIIFWAMVSMMASSKVR